MVPPSVRLERRLIKEGYERIAGVDEAGRGPLAGPVVAAAVMLPHDIHIKGLKDSKKLSPKKREKLYKEIFKKAKSVGIGVIGEGKIDEVNIHQASFIAMKVAIKSLSPSPDIVLVDGRHKIPATNISQKAIVGGDDIVSSIAAASIIAKVTRDAIMLDLAKKYPGWGFARHKGYGTAEHIRLLKKKGPLPIHRKTFMSLLREEDTLELFEHRFYNAKGGVK